MNDLTFENHHTTPTKSIRVFCIQCMGYTKSEVRKCTAPKCPLYPYRLRRKQKNSKLVKLDEAMEICKRE